MDSAFITDRLFGLFHSHKYRISNSYIFGIMGESDFFSLSTTGYAYEVEVKVSRADFFRDFNKGKHKFLENIHKDVWCKRVGPLKQYTGKFSERDRHGIRTSLTEEIGSNIQFVQPKNFKVPNRFLFAVPEGLIKEDEVPPYAGLIYVTNTNINIVKGAPLLHKRKQDLSAILCDKFYYENVRLRFENRQLKASLERYYEKERKQSENA